MIWENYERYIKQVVNIMNKKVKNPRGYFVVGKRQPCGEIINQFIKELEKQDIITHYINLDQCQDENACMTELKIAKKEIKRYQQSGNQLFLVIETFDRLDTCVMDAVKLLIGCQAVGIEMLVSANRPMVHIVGLTEYLIRMNPSGSIYSECYRYST
ncbi:hypothetical protein COE50_27590 [Bacillus anthracis]|nr:hypothetical protein COE50_27590 [Bacillus anthracis]